MLGPFTAAHSRLRNVRHGLADRAGFVLVWDASGGQRLPWWGHQAAVTGLAFSPDGERLASSDAEAKVAVGSSHTGKVLVTLKGHTCVAFSPDGKYVAGGAAVGDGLSPDRSGERGPGGGPGCVPPDPAYLMALRNSSKLCGNTSGTMCTCVVNL